MISRQFIMDTLQDIEHNKLTQYKNTPNKSLGHKITEEKNLQPCHLTQRIIILPKQNIHTYLENRWDRLIDLYDNKNNTIQKALRKELKINPEHKDDMEPLPHEQTHIAPDESEEEEESTEDNDTSDEVLLRLFHSDCRRR